VPPPQLHAAIEGDRTKKASCPGSPLRCGEKTPGSLMAPVFGHNSGILAFRISSPHFRRPNKLPKKLRLFWRVA
jgi:hypothetical protein